MTESDRIPLIVNPSAWETMERMIRRKLEECPEDPKCWFHLGSHLRMTERFEEAEEALKKAIELDRTNDSAWIGLALLYTETSRPEESLTAWTEAYKAQELKKGGVGC